MLFRSLSIVAMLLLIGTTDALSAVGDPISKLEARRFRHACERLAAERAIPQSGRESFLKACFERRAAHRPEARECRAERESKGIDQAHAREFMRQCIREKTSGNR